MAIVFAVRGNSTDARYSNGGKTPTKHNGAGVVAAPGSTLSGSYIDCMGTVKCLVYNGAKNTPNGRAISVLTRFSPPYTGAPISTRALWQIDAGAGNAAANIRLSHVVTTGAIQIDGKNEAIATTFTTTSFGNWTGAVNGTYTDMVFTWDGTTTANAAKLYINGTLLGSLTAAAAMSASMTNEFYRSINIALTTNVLTSSMRLDEFVIWDTVIDPTAVDLVSGVGSLNGASRTSLVNVPIFDGQDWTAITHDQIKTGVTQTQAGVPVLGTYTGADRWSDPGIGNVIEGVSYEADNVGLVGTYDVSSSWTDPGAENVIQGVSYLANGVTKTGTYEAPEGTVVSPNVVVPWPEELQQLVNADSFSMKFGETTIRSDMDTGPQKVRRRFTKSIDPLSCVILLTVDEYTIFRDFYDIDLNGGVNVFEFLHPITNEVNRYRFLNSPEISFLGGIQFRVAMNWEQMP
jgi:hypothetical protein